MLRCKATDKDDKTVDPRFGKVGKQTIEDTGPLTKRRMETVDDETSSAAATYKEFPPRVFPPSFNPATVLEQTLHNIKAVRALHELKEEKVFAAAAGASGAVTSGPAKK